MKRYRIYYQENGRLHKVKGRYYIGPMPLEVFNVEKQENFIEVKACGYDIYSEVHQIVKELMDYDSQSQYCIVDFSTGRLKYASHTSQQ